MKQLYTNLLILVWNSKSNKPLLAAGRMGGLLWMLLLASLASAQITGVVYRDFNASGTREFNVASPTAGEIGVGGVLVTVYSSGTVVSGTAVTSSLSATQGQFSISPTGSAPYRIQFTGLPIGYYDGPKGAQSGTSVQFAGSGTAVINLGINYPADYCQPNPNFLVPCYVNGNPAGSGNAGSQGVLVALAYNSTGNSPTEVALALNRQVGTVYGLAYHRVAKQLFSGAYVKRHSGLGPDGAGAVYLTKIVSNSFVTTNFVTLNAGAVASNEDRKLPATITEANRDETVFDLVGKAGLGDLELSDDGTKLYVVNLSDRKLYEIGIANAGTASPSASTTASFALPTPSPTCPANSIFRPFGLKYYRDRVYVGGVCTNENVTTTKVYSNTAGTSTATFPSNDGMQAVVFAFDPVSATFAQVLSFPLTYRKGATSADREGTDRGEFWMPWTSIQRFTRQEGVVTYAQPMLTDITFDVDGSMIVAIRDRFGDQYGYRNYLLGTGTGTYTGIATGDVLRAGRCSPGVDQWTLESNGRVCSGTATAGANNRQGPGGGEFYVGDMVGAGANHIEMMQGSAVLIPGLNEVAGTAMDATDNLNTGGIRRLSNLNGSGSASTSVQIYGSDAGTFGKANGLGDLEVTCDPAPIEIGSRLWNDGSAVTANGFQENGASSLSGVTVNLYRPGSTTPVATTVTNSAGEYFFNNGLLANTTYEIRIPLSQTVLTAANYRPVKANAVTDGRIDSDAKVVGNDAVITVTTGDYGENNHDLDAGFATCPTITNPSAGASICSGTSVRSLSVATSATEANAIRFVYFTAPQNATAVYAGGTLLGTATPVSGTAGISNVQLPANQTATPVTYYIYALMNSATVSEACLPLQVITVLVNPNPVVAPTSPTICAGQSATLTTTAGYATYRFSGGLTQVGGTGGNTATATPASTTAYSVTAISSAGCSTTGTGTITVRAVLSATVAQGSCNNNGTNATSADDYYLLTVRATVSGSGASSGKYEVVLNANTDGTGGTVLNTGGTTYGQPITLGSARNFKADGGTRYALTIRDSGNLTCTYQLTTTAVVSCSSCLTVLCPKVKLVDL